MKKATKKIDTAVAVAKDNVSPVATEPEAPKTAADLSPTCKSAMMCMMLARPEGATLADISKALGWKERSIRGSISNLVKKGIIKKIYSKKLDADRIYFAEV